MCVFEISRTVYLAMERLRHRVDIFKILLQRFSKLYAIDIWVTGLWLSLSFTYILISQRERFKIGIKTRNAMCIRDLSVQLFRVHSFVCWSFSSFVYIYIIYTRLFVCASIRPFVRHLLALSTLRNILSSSRLSISWLAWSNPTPLAHLSPSINDYIITNFRRCALQTKLKNDYTYVA